jgi:hypothetical protein
MAKLDGMDPKLVRELLSEVQHAARQMETVEARVTQLTRGAGVSVHTTHRPSQVADACSTMAKDVGDRLTLLEKKEKEKGSSGTVHTGKVVTFSPERDTTAPADDPQPADAKPDPKADGKPDHKADGKPDQKADGKAGDKIKRPEPVSTPDTPQAQHAESSSTPPKSEAPKHEPPQATRGATESTHTTTGGKTHGVAEGTLADKTHKTVEGTLADLAGSGTAKHVTETGTSPAGVTATGIAHSTGQPGGSCVGTGDGAGAGTGAGVSNGTADGTGTGLGDGVAGGAGTGGNGTGACGGQTVHIGDAGGQGMSGGSAVSGGQPPSRGYDGQTVDGAKVVSMPVTQPSADCINALNQHMQDIQPIDLPIVHADVANAPDPDAPPGFAEPFEAGHAPVSDPSQTGSTTNHSAGSTGSSIGCTGDMGGPASRADAPADPGDSPRSDQGGGGAVPDPRSLAAAQPGDVLSYPAHQSGDAVLRMLMEHHREIEPIDMPSVSVPEGEWGRGEWVEMTIEPDGPADAVAPADADAFIPPSGS